MKTYRETDGNLSWMRSVSALMIMLAGALAYSNTANVPFVFDDTVRIIYNANIRTLWPTVAMSQSNRPIVNYTFAINHAIHGDAVWGYHAVNFAIHLAAGLTLFGIVVRSLKRSGNSFSQSSEYLALAIALIWVVHPLQTQAVTYINQRYESLMGLFYLWTLYFLIRSIDSKHASVWQVASVAMCALGMGSKEAMVSAPIIALWYDRAFIETSWSSLFAKRKLYYFGLASTWAVLAWAMLHYTDEYTQGGMVVVANVTPWTYLLSQSEVIVHYLRLAYWPQGQCFFGKWPVAHSIQEVFPQAMCIVAILVGTLWSMFRIPQLSFLGGWFFFILAPTSSFIPIRDLIFEHRMYLPLAAVVIVSVLGTFALACRCGRTLAVAKQCHAFLIFVAVVSLTMTTYARNQVYRSEISLWQDTVLKAPHFSSAWHNLGLSLINARRSSEALPFLLQACKLEPNDAHTNSSLGGVLVELGEYELAKPHLAFAVQGNPKDHAALRNSGIRLLDTGNAAESIAYFQRAIQLTPTDPELKMSQVAALILERRYDAAIEECQAVLKLHPNYAKAHLNLLISYSQLGKIDLAIEHGMAAIDAEPNNAATHSTLGMLLAQSSPDNAIEHLKIAYKLDSTNRECGLLLGKMLAKDHPQEAIPFYQSILVTDPSNVEVQYKLASLYVTCNELDKAIAQMEAVVKLRPDSQEALSYLERLRKAAAQK